MKKVLGVEFTEITGQVILKLQNSRIILQGGELVDICGELTDLWMGVIDEIEVRGKYNVFITTDKGVVWFEFSENAEVHEC